MKPTCTIHTFTVKDQTGKAMGEQTAIVNDDEGNPFTGKNLFEIIEIIQATLPPGFKLEHAKTEENVELDVKHVEVSVTGRIIIEHVAGQGFRTKIEGSMPVEQAVMAIECLKHNFVQQQIQSMQAQNQPRIQLPNGPLPPPNKKRFRM